MTMKRKKGIFRSMICGVSILIVLTVLVFDALIMMNTWKNEQDLCLRTAEQLSTKVQNAVETFVDQMDATIVSIHYELMLSSDGYVYKLFSSHPYASSSESVAVNHYMNRFYAKLNLMQPDLISAYTYVNNQKQYYWSKRGRQLAEYTPTNTDWFHETIERDGQIYARINYTPDNSTYGQPVIGFSRKLKNLTNNEISGDSVILLEYSIAMLEDIVSSYITDEYSQVLFVDSQGEVKYAYGGESSPAKISPSVLDNQSTRITQVEDRMVCLAVGSKTVQGWHIVVLSDYQKIMDSFGTYIFISAGVALVMIFLAMIPAYLYVRKLSGDVEQLEHGMQKLCEGDFSIHLSTGREDEIGSLVHSFNTMAGKTQVLIRQQYEQELEKREAEYKFLQAQIDPHFIFNSLQVISSMAIVNGIEGIEAVSNSLARLLSYSLTTGSKVITVEEELENVKQYMVIQQTRFKNRLSYRVDVAPRVRECQIIKMVLQPIVENAIMHGFEPKGKKCTILVQGFMKENGYVIMISDNGAGMEAEQLTQLKQFINGDNNAQVEVKGHGVGLRNINNRLKLYYGDEYGLIIESEPGVGTTVVIHVSFEAGEEE